MHTLEFELRALHAAGTLDDATAARAIALERGEVFSVHGELRLMLYAGATLVIGGVGTILARNLEQIGPLSIVLALGLAAVACALPALRMQLAQRALTAVAEYVLLLGVLLVSADLAYAEHTFALLGPLWPWHLLLLAVFHTAVAYAFGSSLVLAAALGAFAGWFGVGFSAADAPLLGSSPPEIGARALLCAATIAAWRYADRASRPTTTFSDVFDHFGANLAFWGACAWCRPMPWLLAGVPLLAVLATMSVRHGLRTGRAVFVVYGVLYAAVGACMAFVPRIDGVTVASSFALVVVMVAAATLWRLYQRVREVPA